MKHFFKIILFVTACVTAQNTQRKFISYKENPNGLEVTVSDGTYQIVFYNENTVETTFLPTGEAFNPNSHAVVLKPVAVKKISALEIDGFVQFMTAGISVAITKSPFKISYAYKGNRILSEKKGYTKTEQGEFLDFNIDNIEALYGGGARAIGMNRRGNRLQLYNKAQYGYGDRAELLNFTMPLVLSSKIYAVHFDNAAIGWLDLDSKKDNTLTYETISGRKTYQVIAGDSWPNLIDNYTALTGRQPLPPRWMFGNLASRFGYHSQKQVREVVEKFKADKIPLEAIILDLYWFGKDIKGTLGNFEFLKDSFPNPEKMIADLKAKNIQTVLITEPFVLTTAGKWQEAVDKKILATDAAGKAFTYDFYFGNTGLIDIFKPEGKAWFWSIYKKYIDMGVGGWWGDLGEPEVHPTQLQHATGTADELHNIYGHNWAKLVYEGYQKDFPSVRPFILMRAGYSGSQRYGMIPWSGDVGRNWGGLRSQLEISLEMGMQGMGYMHSDLGGFAGDNVDNELYTRWLQYGVFQPVFRPHASESVPPEPVFREAKTKALAKKSIELRYQLMPYNYSLAFENSLNGMPLMRPLFFEEPDNDKLLGRSDSYLWGNDFLVSPITQPNVTEKEIYFPKSGHWFDFYTGKKYAAGSTANVTVAEDHIPTFVRGGAFIPMAKPFLNTAAYSLVNFDLHYWFDESVANSKGWLYDDDGKTPDAYQKQLFERMTFRSRYKNNTLLILMDLDKGKLNPANKNITLVIHNIQAQPKNVSIDGKKMKSIWTESTKILEIAATYKNDKPREIQIQLQ